MTDAVERARAAKLEHLAPESPITSDYPHERAELLRVIDDLVAENDRLRVELDTAHQVSLEVMRERDQARADRDELLEEAWYPLGYCRRCGVDQGSNHEQMCRLAPIVARIAAEHGEEVT